MGLSRLMNAFTTDCEHVARSRAAWSTRLRLLGTLLRLYAMPLAGAPHGGVERRILGFRIAAFDARILRFLYREIFIHRDYDFEAARPDPVVLDCGANIGMATLFFVWRYPDAEVHAFEPDPATFAFLERNIESNGLNNAHPHRVALSDAPGHVAFYRDASNPGHPMMSTVRTRMPGDEMVVEAITLSSFLDREIPGREVDLLKLDVEGAEGAVLADLASSGSLSRVRELVIEYHHHMGGEPSRLGKFIATLEEAGFSYQIRTQAFPLGASHQFQDVLLYCYRPKGRAGSAGT